MNIAQATLREVVDPEDRDDDLANISLEFTGGEYQSRNVRKYHRNYFLPSNF